MFIKNKEIQAIYRGSKLVNAIYKGLRQIYSSGRKPEVNEFFYTTMAGAGEYDFPEIEGWVQKGWDESAKAYVVEVPIVDNTLTIPNDAFTGVNWLFSVQTNKNVDVVIGDGAFQNCIKLTKVGMKIKSFGKQCLQNTAISGVKVDDGCTLIDDYAFVSCSHLKSVRLPQTMAEGFTHGIGLFDTCTSLNDITLPENWGEIKNGEFYGSGITNINYLGDITYIGNEAFKSCTSLTEFILPHGLESMGTGVFADSAVNKIITKMVDAVPSVSSYTFQDIMNDGKLFVNDVEAWGEWLGTDEYYLGYYGWVAPSKPSAIVNCIANFNVNRYEVGSSLQSIESTDGSFDGSLELYGEALTVQANDDPIPYIDFYGNTMYSYRFDTPQDNIFNFDNLEEDFTIIATTHYAGGTNLFANRDETGYSWMLRPEQYGWYLHPSEGDGVRTGSYGQNNLNTIAFSFNHLEQKWYMYSINPITGLVLTEEIKGVNGRYVYRSNGVSLGSGYSQQLDEPYNGRFSWLFVSKEYLTLDGILEVIAYNTPITRYKYTTQETWVCNEGIKDFASYPSWQYGTGMNEDNWNYEEGVKGYRLDARCFSDGVWFNHNLQPLGEWIDWYDDNGEPIGIFKADLISPTEVRVTTTEMISARNLLHNTGGNPTYLDEIKDTSFIKEEL